MAAWPFGRASKWWRETQLDSVKFVAKTRQADVFVGQATRVMCGPSDGDLVVNIAPFGVVVVLFRSLGHLSHEGEGLHKIGQDKFPRDGTALRIQGPVRQA